MPNLTYANTIAIQRSNISKHLIEYANSIIADFYGIENISFDKSVQDKAIKKARKQYKKLFKNNIYHDHDVDVGEHLVHFSIPFTLIPDQLFTLMENINWLQYDTKEPISNKIMFYCSKWHDDTNRNTICEWYIDFNGYVDLLFIDSQLKSFYSPNEVA